MQIISLNLIRFLLKIALLWIVAIFFTQCKNEPPSIISNQMSVDKETQQLHDDAYQRWRNATKVMPPYSKTTAYSNLQEFRDIIECGKPILPLLHRKIEDDEGVDFVLSLAVIKIMGWPDEQFSTTNMTQLRDDVLHRM
jgi:hypothetical protein